MEPPQTYGSVAVAVCGCVVGMRLSVVVEVVLGAGNSRWKTLHVKSPPRIQFLMVYPIRYIQLAIFICSEKTWFFLVVLRPDWFQKWTMY